MKSILLTSMALVAIACASAVSAYQQSNDSVALDGFLFDEAMAMNVSFDADPLEAIVPGSADAVVDLTVVAYGPDAEYDDLISGQENIDTVAYLQLDDMMLGVAGEAETDLVLISYLDDVDILLPVPATDTSFDLALMSDIFSGDGSAGDATMGFDLAVTSALNGTYNVPGAAGETVGVDAANLLI